MEITFVKSDHDRVYNWPQNKLKQTGWGSERPEAHIQQKLTILHPPPPTGMIYKILRSDWLHAVDSVTIGD